MLGGNAWFSTVVAAAVLWHAVVGCCAHHAHAVETQTGVAPEAAQAEVHHGTSHGNHHGPAGHRHDHAPPADHDHDEEQSPHEDDCGEGNCSSLLTAFQKPPRDVSASPLMLPPPRVHGVATQSQNSERRAVDVPLIPAAAGSRLHCALSLWLL